MSGPYPNEGGSAFPDPPVEHDKYWYSGSPGMSLRAWLAGKALSGVCITETNLPDHVIARQVVSVADAVLRQLQQPDPDQMKAMRYTTALEMLLQIRVKFQERHILALTPNRVDDQEFWDVVDICQDPYNPHEAPEHGVVARDADPLNAVATAAKVLAESGGAT